MENKTIFKTGDRVYHHYFSWGTVKEIYINNGYFNLYIIDFDNNKYENYIPEYEISFTEYTLNNFSQEKPINYEDYIGKWGKFWDDEDERNFVVSKLIEVKNESFKDVEEWGWFDNFKPLTKEQIEILELDEKV